jgi:hypothetical protein
MQYEIFYIFGTFTVAGKGNILGKKCYFVTKSNRTKALALTEFFSLIDNKRKELIKGQLSLL